jgi:uncharacterized SAM-binding protein YcdF (DUF218 family)
VDFIFVASKIFIFGVLSPAPLIILLIVLGFKISKSPKLQITTFISAFFLWFLSTDFGGLLVIKPLESQYSKPVELNANYDAVVSLGGGAGFFSSDNNLSSPTERRFMEAFLIASKKNLPLVFSGGGEKIGGMNEAKCVEARTKYIMGSLGISAPMIFKPHQFSFAYDDKSQDTFENAKESYKIIASSGVKTPSIVLVTSATHMNRSVRLFEKAGFKVTPKATDFLYNDKPFFDPFSFLPSFGQLANSFRAIYEYFGLLKFFILSR